MNTQPEIAVLLAAISARSAVPASFNEARLLTLATHHRLVPHVARCFAQNDVHAPMIATAARANSLHNLRLLGHVAVAMDALTRNGIDAVAIKGPVLAHQLYGDAGMRTCVDIDVLVPRNAVRDCVPLLAQHGFQSVIATDAASLDKHFVREHDLQFRHEDGSLLELHVDIAQPHYSYRVDLNEWFERARVISVGGSRVRTLALEDAALLAVIHGTKHAWSRLDLVADLSGFAAQAIDWPRVAAQAHAVGAVRALQVSRLLLAELAGGLAVTASPADARLARSVADRLLASSERGFWETRLFDLAVRERLSDRLRYALRLGFGIQV